MAPGEAMTNATIPQEVWDHRVAASAPQPVAWLWHGFVAAGNLTLLTSQGKAGKSTLLSAMRVSGQKFSNSAWRRLGCAVNYYYSDL